MSPELVGATKLSPTSMSVFLHQEIRPAVPCLERGGGFFVLQDERDVS